MKKEERLFAALSGVRHGVPCPDPGVADAFLLVLRVCQQAPGADKIVEDRELEEILDRFLRTLPERDCSVFLRRYWYGETLEEAARRYGMKLNTAISRSWGAI